MEYITTDLIDATIAAAEQASYAKTGSFGGWVLNYGGPNNEDLRLLGRDFIWMRREIERMRAKTFELECAAEAAGVKVPL